MRALIYTALLLAAVGCGRGGSNNSTDSTDSVEMMAGADRDDHGCIGSAGYTWSGVLGRCIRIFEDGIRMESPETPGMAAYLVFATDSLRVEVFSPDGTSAILDRRTLPSGSYAWNIEDDDTMNVRRIDGVWTVEKRGKTIYFSE